MSVPNQFIVVVKKDKADKDHPYSCINLEAIDYAAVHLRTIGAFKLWFYIAKNQNKYEFELSRAAFCAWSGLSHNSYQDGIKVLREQSFLVPCPQQKNKLIFYEKPIKENMERTNDYTIVFPKDNSFRF